MALLFMEGFDQYAYTSEIATVEKFAGSTVSGSTSYFSLVQGRSGDGTQCAAMNWNSNARLQARVPEYSGDTLIVGYALRSSGTDTSRSAMDVYGVNNDILVSIRRSSMPGYMTVKNGDGDLLGSFQAADGAWTYIEIRAKFDPVAGEIEVRVNGSSTPVLNVTGVDTVDNSSVAPYLIDRVEFQPGNNGAFSYYDDIYICDTAGAINSDFLGDSVVRFVRPGGDSGTPDWSRSAGSANFENVNNAADDGDATYNYSETAGDTDLFTFGALDTSDKIVRGVMVTARLRKEDAGPRSVKLHAAAELSGEIEIPGVASYDGLSSVFNTVDGSTPWGSASIDALVAGYELI